MSMDWNYLPFVPLMKILDYLPLEDALQAMSTCHHWRQAIRHYQGYRRKLTLRAKNVSRSMFLTRLFKKYTITLVIYVDCSREALDKFCNSVLPMFYDALSLREIIFMGPCYTHQNLQHSLASRLRRTIVETLLVKQLKYIQKVALMDCKLDVAQEVYNKNHRKSIGCYSNPLSFDSITSEVDGLLSKTNISLMMYSSLRHIILDYDQISTESLETLSSLPNFKHLTLNICDKRRPYKLLPIKWTDLQSRYETPLEVGINLIGLDFHKIDEVVSRGIFALGLNLISLKVLYCKTLHVGLINVLVREYNSTLKEIVWCDSPNTTGVRSIHHRSNVIVNLSDINPFILVCWKCKELQRLVLHGYWVWHYDILGMIRLCPTLLRVEMSSIYVSDNAIYHSTKYFNRVLSTDKEIELKEECIQEINKSCCFEWRPIKWSELHSGLRARPSMECRAAYIALEATGDCVQLLQ